MVIKEERKELWRRERILIMRRFNDNSSTVDGYKRGEKGALEKGNNSSLEEV